jgi:cytoskeletal protein CcmA (bactofilin family)
MATVKELGGTGPDNTVIGQSILISGKLTGDEDLTVRGRVEGELTLSRTLIVEPSGVVKANVAVKNAIVSGVVVGNINATESVELTREGRMVGDIHSPRVIIVDGASFRGRVDMGEVEPGRVPAGRPTIRPAVRAVAAPPRPPAPPAAATRSSAPPAPPPRPAAAPPRPVTVGAKAPAVGKPLPPPPPSFSKAPSAPSVSEAGKKKVVVKKKGK